MSFLSTLDNLLQDIHDILQNSHKKKLRKGTDHDQFWFGVQLPFNSNKKYSIAYLPSYHTICYTAVSKKVPFTDLIWQHSIDFWTEGQLAASFDSKYIL